MSSMAIAPYIARSTHTTRHQVHPGGLGARRLPHAGAGRAGRAARLTARDSSRGGSGSSTSTDSVTAPQAGTEQHAAASPLPEIELEYVEPSGGQKAWTSFKLAFALPWRRFKKDSVLVLKLSGEIAEQPQGRFSPTVSLPALCECLKKAALDPRVAGVVVKIDPLSCGWSKLQELRRHVEYFRASGKFSVAYLERAGEKEYYLASAFEEVYAPPSASLSLRGISVSGTFLRTALEKVGVQPEVRRIGKYKSAGDQLLRADMSEAQREQLSALLDDIYGGFVRDVAASRGKTTQEVEELLDEGVFDMEVYKQRGFVTDLLYECELEEMLKKRTGGKEDELPSVGFKKYRAVSPSAFVGMTKKAVAIIRASGAITGGSGGTGITSGDVIRQLRSLQKNKRIAAIVLRIDSGGGDALASDLMWREIQELGKTKPVIASLSDVAASGGYYMAMACSKIVAEPLTITGSIGVVTGKFNLQELYSKIGYAKETISRGKYAQLLAEQKPFSAEEEALFDASAQHAYESFRNKAASSRGMTIEAMQEYAQGRVWSGQQAVSRGLIDELGGVSRAIQMAKQAAGLAADDAVRVLEVSRAKTSPLALIAGGGGGASASLPALGLMALQFMLGGNSAASGAMGPAAAIGAPLLIDALIATMAATSSASSAPLAMDAVVVEGVGSQALLSQGSAAGCDSGSLFDV